MTATNWEVETLTGRPYWEEKATRDTVALCDDVLKLVHTFAPDCVFNFEKKHDIGFIVNGPQINFAICKPIKKSFKLGIKQPESDLFESKLIKAGLKKQGVNRYEGWLYVPSKELYYIHLTKYDIEKYSVFLTKILRAAYNKTIN